MSPAGWSTSSSPERRRILAALPLLALGACGFRPLYAEAPPGRASATAAGDLAATRVALIADREGQLLRRALQQKLGSDRGVPARFELAVTMEVRREQTAVRPDQTETRSRVSALAAYTLRPLAPPAEQPLAQGRALAVDAFNVGRDQFFAAQLSAEAALERVTERLAEDIAGQLAAFFARQRAAAQRT